MNTSSPQTPVTSDADRFGPAVQAIAAAHGIKLEDTALAVAAFLGNIAGPHASVEDHCGRPVQPGINMIYAGNGNVAGNALQEFCIHPIRHVQNQMRLTAQELQRSTVDASTYGFPNAAGSLPPGMSSANSMWQHHLERERATLEALKSAPYWHPFAHRKNSLGLPDDGPLNAGNTAPFRSPSFLLEGTSSKEIPRMLSEVLGGQAFAFDPRGVLLKELKANSKNCETRCDELLQWLSGRDFSFKPRHPEQGYGTLQFCRLRLWSRATEEHLAQWLEAHPNEAQQLLGNCLCWTPQPCQWTTGGTTSTRSAYERYQSGVNEVLRCRTERDFPSCALSDQIKVQLTSLQHGYHQWLTQLEATHAVTVGGFYDLPYQLWWGLNRIAAHEAPVRFTVCFELARYAVQRHADFLQTVRSEAGRKREAYLEKEILSHLMSKGPFTFRQFVRSRSNQRKEYWLPHFKALEAKGIICRDENSLYRLCECERDCGQAHVEMRMQIFTGNTCCMEYPGKCPSQQMPPMLTI